MVDVDQPPNLETMSKLTFLGHGYIVSTLVRLSGSFPQVPLPYSDFAEQAPNTPRLDELHHPIVHTHEGRLCLMALPKDFKAPEDLSTVLKCRLASKHHLKKCLADNPSLGNVFGGIFDEIPDDEPRAVGRPPAEPPQRQAPRPQYAMQPVTPGPNSAGGHRPNPTRAYPGNGVDIRQATPRSNSTRPGPR